MLLRRIKDHALMAYKADIVLEFHLSWLEMHLGMIHLFYSPELLKSQSTEAV
jgi:hypothetical protein